MPRIYLSYAQEDADYAEGLSGALERAGLDVASASTLRPEDPQPWDDRIEAAMLASDAVVFLLSPAALQSVWFQREMDHAQMARSRGLGGVIVPILLRPTHLPEALASARAINAMGLSPEEVAQTIRALVATDGLYDIQERAHGITYPAPDLDNRTEEATKEEADGLASAAPSQVTPPAPPAPAPASPPTPAEQPAAGRAPGAPAGAPAPKVESARKQAKEAAAETLQFSAYHANALAVAEWNTLLVYAAAGDAMAAVAADAATFTELGSAPRTSTGHSARVVAQGAELTIEPHLEGVSFSPPTDTFIWRGGWHRSLFRFQAAAALAGSERDGWVDIYAGPMVPIARIDLAFTFTLPRAALGPHPPAGRTVTSNPHDTVFISYSHRDREPFRQACEEYARFGITVHTDEHLAAGADYERELGQMIAGARVFHLLWSPTAAGSVECKKEWMAALLREPTERFIKPWYWRQPLAAPPPELAQHHISFRFQRLRRKLWKPETWR